MRTLVLVLLGVVLGALSAHAQDPAASGPGGCFVKTAHDHRKRTSPHGHITDRRRLQLRLRAGGASGPDLFKP